MTKTESKDDLIYIDLCKYLHGKMLLKEVCEKHGIKHSRAVHLANRIVNYTPQIGQPDIYKTSKLTVEEYVALKSEPVLVNKVVNKISFVEEEIAAPMDDTTRKRVMEFINLTHI